MGWTNDDDIDETEQTQEDEKETMTEQNDDVDISSLAPSAMDVNEAAEQEHTFTIMWWGNESVGKSHACYTFPQPVCIIDTEHKADDIAHKFSDKEVFLWQPNDFDEAVEARDEALNLLSEWEAKTGEKGTLVVDSMADMWDWSQYKYIDKYYNNTDPEDVNLSLEDWGPIKKIHNEKFRQAIDMCDYHVSWTATRKDDVGTAVEENLDETPDKPGGETNNAYKANSIVRLYMNSNGIPVGDLQKSGILRFKYLGLERPTFPKHKEIVEHVQEIEQNGADTVDEVEAQYNLEYDLYGFTEANTMRFIE